MRVEMEAELRSEYPYRVVSHAGRGIGRAIDDFQEAWPRLAGLMFGSCGGIVNYFTKSHYTPHKTTFVSELSSFLSEDLLVRGLAQWLRSGPVWGAGLLFLSRYPIVSSAFHPHGSRADWEMLAGKGVLEAVVRTPEGVDVTFSHGHYQEGVTTRAVRARLAQIRESRERTMGPVGDIMGPLIHMGDFNVAGGSREHEVMNEVLGLNDVQAGDTYEEPNVFQDKLQAPKMSGVRPTRIDYIYHSDDLIVQSAKVHLEEFRAHDLGIDLSDHRALGARFFYRSGRASAARARPRQPAPSLLLQSAAALV
jgi:endonuclease/exonuclease/phosphatase family metal-dependent hydrolase